MMDMGMNPQQQLRTVLLLARMSVPKRWSEALAGLVWAFFIFSGRFNEHLSIVVRLLVLFADASHQQLTL